MEAPLAWTKRGADFWTPFPSLPWKKAGWEATNLGHFFPLRESWREEARAHRTELRAGEKVGSRSESFSRQGSRSLLEPAVAVAWLRRLSCWTGAHWGCPGSVSPLWVGCGEGCCLVSLVRRSSDVREIPQEEASSACGHALDDETSEHLERAECIVRV